jgi:hypothetical protein
MQEHFPGDFGFFAFACFAPLSFIWKSLTPKQDCHPEESWERESLILGRNLRVRRCFPALRWSCAQAGGSIVVGVDSINEWTAFRQLLVSLSNSAS